MKKTIEVHECPFFARSDKIESKGLHLGYNKGMTGHKFNNKTELWQSLLSYGLGTYAVLTLFSMATMSIGIIFVIVPLFGLLWNEHKTKGVDWTPLKSNYAYILTSFFLVAACALSLILASFFPLSYAGRSVEIHFFKAFAKAWYFLWPIIILLALSRLSFDHRKKVLAVWILFFIFISCFGLFQYFYGWPRPQRIPGNEERFHVTIFFGHHLSVASIWIFPLFVGLDFIHKKAKILFLPKWFLLIGAILGTVVLFMTYSRTLWVALPIGLIAWVLLNLKTWKNRILILISLFVISAGLLQFDFIKNRLSDGLGTGTRIFLWEANLEFFKNRPIIGVGWRQNQELSGYYLMQKEYAPLIFSGHAHNNFMEILGSLGALGTVAWFAWWILVLALTWQFLQNKKALFFAKGLFAAWVVFHLNGLTQVNFWEGKVLHQVMWMVGWVLFWNYKFKEEQVG